MNLVPGVIQFESKTWNKERPRGSACMQAHYEKGAVARVSNAWVRQARLLGCSSHMRAGSSCRHNYMFHSHTPHTRSPLTYPRIARSIPANIRTQPYTTFTVDSRGVELPCPYTIVQRTSAPCPYLVFVDDVASSSGRVFSLRHVSRCAEAPRPLLVHLCTWRYAVDSEVEQLLSTRACSTRTTATAAFVDCRHSSP